jgi:hypothetical protein
MLWAASDFRQGIRHPTNQWSIICADGGIFSWPANAGERAAVIRPEHLGEGAVRW